MSRTTADSAVLVGTPDPLAEAMSVAAIRACFPALERMHAAAGRTPRHVAYFDGPGGTQVPRQVVERMTEYMFHHNANTHWAYPSSAETDAMIDGARRAAADFLNAQPNEIAFGANMTTLAFHLARALGRAWGPGDEVVVTELDHHANVAPWTTLAAERGVTVRTVRMRPEDGRLDMQDLERQLSARSRLLAVGAASNALGTITDVRAAAALARSVGALTFVDAVHYAPHVLVDVGALECDFLACSAYKFYGPHVGLLYGREALLAGVQPPKLAPAPDSVPERLETGTLNHEGIAGTAAAIDFLASLAGAASAGTASGRRERLAAAFAAVHERSVRQVARTWDALSRIEGVTLYGPAPALPRTSTVSFTIRGMTAEEVVRQLAACALFASHGDFYARTVVERLGLQPHGLVRVGYACYTADDEVERLIAAVQEIAAGRAA